MARYLLVGLFCLALWPGETRGQSLESSDAFNRGSALFAQGRYQEAQPFLEKALRLSEQEFGPDHPNTAAVMSSLALLYRDQGKYVEAEPLYQRSLMIVEKVLGPEHPDVATSLNNLAILYQDQGRYDKELLVLKRMLTRSENSLGPNHPDLIGLLDRYSVSLRIEGQYHEARTFDDQANAIRVKHGGTIEKTNAEWIRSISFEGN